MPLARYTVELSHPATGWAELQELVEWATPIQQRHFEGAMQGSLQLAAEEDPNAPEEG